MNLIKLLSIKNLSFQMLNFVCLVSCVLCLNMSSGYAQPCVVQPFIVEYKGAICDSCSKYAVEPVNLSYTYTWTASNGLTGTDWFAETCISPNGGWITFTATNPAGPCSLSQTLTLYPCCKNATYDFTQMDIDDVVTNAQLYPLLTITSGTYVEITPTSPGVTISVNGWLNITQSTRMHGVEILYGADANCVIRTGNNLYLDNNCYFHACEDYLWRGIEIEDGAKLNTQNSVIEDAFLAAHAVESGRVESYNGTIWNANRTDIQLENNFALSNNLIVQGSIFQCHDLGSGLPVTLNAPYTNDIPLCGIQLTNCLNLTLGNPLEATALSQLNRNIFRRHGCAVWLQNSDVNIYNNRFEDIHNFNNSGFGYAIQADGLGHGAVLSTTNIGAQNIGNIHNDNIFENCTGGIQILRDYNANISHNRFTNISQIASPIQIRACISLLNNQNCNYLVSNNTMNNFRNGVNIRRLNNSGFYIQNNNFNMQYNYAGTEGLNAIRVVNGLYSNMQSNVAQIQGNNIRFVRTGVFAGNYGALQIDVLNQIEYNPTTIAANPNVVRYAIRINGGQGHNVVDGNFIYKTGANPTQALDNTLMGINIQNSEDNIVSNNIIEKLGTGVRFFNTAIANNIYCNVLDKNRINLRLESAKIGDQKSTGDPQKNQWVTYNLTDKNVRGYGISYPTQFFTHDLTGVWWSATGDLFPLFTYDFSLVQDNGTCELPCPGCPDGSRQQDFANIILALYDYANLSADELYNLRRAVFEQLKIDDSYLYMGTNYDFVLQNFFTDWNNGNTGLLNNYTSTLVSDTDSLATALISNISPTNLAEENERAVLEIYNATWALEVFEFTALQQQILADIAIQNPVTGGVAVYYARAMLDEDVDDFIIDNGNRYGLQAIDEKANRAGYEIVLLENNDNLFVSEKTNTLISEISVLNVYGQTVYQKTGFKMQYTLPLQIFSNGLYIIKVNLEQGFVLNSKYFSK